MLQKTGRAKASKTMEESHRLPNTKFESGNRNTWGTNLFRFPFINMGGG
jgi:hypothetical protein